MQYRSDNGIANKIGTVPKGNNVSILYHDEREPPTKSNHAITVKKSKYKTNWINTDVCTCANTKVSKSIQIR